MSFAVSRYRLGQARRYPSQRDSTPRRQNGLTGQMGSRPAQQKPHPFKLVQLMRLNPPTWHLAVTLFW